ncbi:acyltransferase family protein [Xanthomonas hortorum]|uniref:acyltransferase family protein n=1 Tax=Xanthomonas hortorum TaxID=56454 RepID=UPI0029372FDD|nr:acyltransferase [Xanthomonas hortorum]
MQYLRAIAAFAVVLCHASYYVKDVRGDGRMWEIFDRAGGLGVGLFFAISGYLMAQLAQNNPPLKFLTHRIIRIYPIYWLSVLVVVVAGMPFGKFAWPDMTALLLVPGLTQSYVLGVEWTLPFELTFYVIVFLLILLGLGRKLPIVAVFWVFLIEVFLVVKPGLQQGQFPGLLHLPLSAFSLPFAMGMVVPWAVNRGLVGPATPLVAAAFLFFSESMAGISAGLFYGFSAIGCTLLVAWAVRHRQTEGEPIAALLALGDWSYALYLIHAPIIIALCKYLPLSVGTMQLWFAAVGLPLIAAVIFGKIDIGLYRIVKRKVDLAPRKFRVALCVIFLALLASISAFHYAQVFQNKIDAENVEPVALRVEALLSESKQGDGLLAAARRAGLSESIHLKGNFDGVYDQGKSVRVHGWAASLLPEDKVKVLIFHCGKYLGVAPNSENRPDVAQVLRIAERRSGFTSDLAKRGECSEHNVEGLILGQRSEFILISGSF